MAPRTWCPAGIFGLFCPLALACSSLTTALTASLLGEPEEVALGPMAVVAATLEVVGTRAMGVAGIMTVDLEGMDMDMDVPETIMAETRVVMTATQEEITETITTTEMRHAHNVGETWISALS
ncbi:hypothetical protein H8958_015256, partial [Nasalis larvatus]